MTSNIDEETNGNRGILWQPQKQKKRKKTVDSLLEKISHIACLIFFHYFFSREGKTYVFGGGRWGGIFRQPFYFPHLLTPAETPFGCLYIKKSIKVHINIVKILTLISRSSKLGTDFLISPMERSAIRIILFAKLKAGELCSLLKMNDNYTGIQVLYRYSKLLKTSKK